MHERKFLTGSLLGRMRSITGAKTKESLLQGSQKHPKQGGSGQSTGGFEKPRHMSRGLAAIVGAPVALQGAPPRFSCIKAGFSLVLAHFVLRFSGVFFYPFLHSNRVENTIFHHFLHRFSSDSVGSIHGCSWYSLLWHFGRAWEGLIMRRSLGGGWAPFLMVTGHLSRNFLEMPLLFFTPH